MKIHAAIFLSLAVASFGDIKAEQIEMKNGDRYAGKVISMTVNSVVLQSDMLGKITVPRAKVASITLGPAVAAAPVPSAPPAAPRHPPASIIITNSHTDISSALQNLGANTNFIDDIRKQFLAGAGPEANAKYDDMVSGLFSGKFDMASLRAQAKAAANQIRELKKQDGEVGGTLDSYLAILDSFLKESASAPPTAPTPLPVATNNGAKIFIGH